MVEASRKGFTTMFLLLLGVLVAFGYVACNIGANNSKRGHESYGFAPAIWVLVVVVIGWLAWPFIGHAVSSFLFAFGGVR